MVATFVHVFLFLYGVMAIVLLIALWFRLPISVKNSRSRPQPALKYPDTRHVFTVVRPRKTSAGYVSIKQTLP